jgi:hypothetical protein
MRNNYCSVNLVTTAFITWCLYLLPITMAISEEDEPEILHGIYSSQQAELGSVVFGEICRQCHLPRDFIDIFYSENDLYAQIVDYYDLIRTTMPQDAPGRLSEQDYQNVIAYFLSLNEISPSAK